MLDIRKFIDKFIHISINFNTKKVMKFILIGVGVYLLGETFMRTAHAGVLEMMGGPDLFNGLSGNGKYLGEPYRYNYYLDIVDLGSLAIYNKATNFISNFCWELGVIVTYGLLLAFNLAFSMDIANLFTNILNDILSAMKTSIFDEYVYVAITIGLIFVLKSFWKKNLAQALSRLFYMSFTFTLAAVITMYSGQIVSTMTQLSKGIGASSIVSISDTDGTKNNIAQISGTLWGTLVHRPWLELEADDKLSNEEVEKILKLDRDSDKRADLIEDFNNKDPELFSENVGEGRVVPSLLLGVVNLGKMIVMIIIAMIQIAFQILTILLVLVVPFLLLLSIVPGMGGYRLFTSWAQEILGAQVGIVFASFLLGFLIKVDELIANYISTLVGGTYGWLAITMLQVLVYIGVVWQRERIFELLRKIQNNIATAGIGNVIIKEINNKRLQDGNRRDKNNGRNEGSNNEPSDEEPANSRKRRDFGVGNAISWLAYTAMEHSKGNNRENLEDAPSFNYNQTRESNETFNGVDFDSNNYNGNSSSKENHEKMTEKPPSEHPNLNIEYDYSKSNNGSKESVSNSDNLNTKELEFEGKTNPMKDSVNSEDNLSERINEAYNDEKNLNLKPKVLDLNKKGSRTNYEDQSSQYENINQDERSSKNSEDISKELDFTNNKMESVKDNPRYEEVEKNSKSKNDIKEREIDFESRDTNSIKESPRYDEARDNSSSDIRNREIDFEDKRINSVRENPRYEEIIEDSKIDNQGQEIDFENNVMDKVKENPKYEEVPENSYNHNGSIDRANQKNDNIRSEINNINNIEKEVSTRNKKEQSENRTIEKPINSKEQIKKQQEERAKLFSKKTI